MSNATRAVYGRFDTDRGRGIGSIAPGAANPYRIAPASPWFHVVNVSGSRSSGFMLRQVLDAHGGALPARCEAVFANTGRERPETLKAANGPRAGTGGASVLLHGSKPPKERKRSDTP